VRRRGYVPQAQRAEQEQWAAQGILLKLERMKYSTELGEGMRKQLFDPKAVDGAVMYVPKPGLAETAKPLWRFTGVCPECFMRSVSDGRCCCGWRSEGNIERERKVRAEAKAKEDAILQAIAEDDARLAGKGPRVV
jgi:hypothetical protein